MGGYTITGRLLDPIWPGRRLRLLRLARDGVTVIGITTTPPVVEVHALTANSVYYIHRFMPPILSTDHPLFTDE